MGYCREDDGGEGREIQTTIKASPGDAYRRDLEAIAVGNGGIIPSPLIAESGKPRQQPTPHHWAGNGRIILKNNQR